MDYLSKEESSNLRKVAGVVPALSMQDSMYIFTTMNPAFNKNSRPYSKQIN